jgi:hypothetical protein
MRSEAQCLAKAIEMDAKAAACGDAAACADFTQMALYWRELAALAAAQNQVAVEHPA